MLQKYIRPFVKNESGEKLLIRDDIIWCENPKDPYDRNVGITNNDYEINVGSTSFLEDGIFDSHWELEEGINPSGNLVFHFSLTGKCPSGLSECEGWLYSYWCPSFALIA